MNATTKELQTALSLPERAAVALGTAAHEIKLRELVQNSCRIVAVTNDAGRDECHSAYMALKNADVAVGHKVEDATEDAKAYTKAVKSEGGRLLAITESEKTRLKGLRDGWDAAKQAAKDAAIAAERARTDAIQADIQMIRDLVLDVAGESSVEIAEAIATLAAIVVTQGRFDGFEPAAIQAVAMTGDKLGEMLDAAIASEAAFLVDQIASIAEAARITAEAAQLAADRAELVEQQRVAKIESDRIAAEQAATAKRLADQEATQALVAKLLAEKAAENLKAERDAQELAMRLEREKQAAAQAERDRVAADTKRQLDEQQAEITAQLANLQRAQDAEIARQDAAIKLISDHAEALSINAAGHYYHATLKRDDGHSIMCNPNGSRSIFCDVDEGDDDAAAHLARCTATADAMITNGRSLVQANASLADHAGPEDRPAIDYEAIAWAYKQLRAFGVGEVEIDNAVMMDRLNAMLVAEVVA